MSGMETLHELPLVNDAPLPPDEKMQIRIKGELGELQPLVTVTRIRLPKDGGPPRYDFQFPAGELQYKTRISLERKHFDVGQEMLEAQLKYFISRRVSATAGWDV